MNLKTKLLVAALALGSAALGSAVTAEAAYLDASNGAGGTLLLTVWDTANPQHSYTRDLGFTFGTFAPTSSINLNLAADSSFTSAFGTGPLASTILWDVVVAQKSGTSNSLELTSLNTPTVTINKTGVQSAITQSYGFTGSAYIGLLNGGCTFNGPSCVSLNPATDNFNNNASDGTSKAGDIFGTSMGGNTGNTTGQVGQSLKFFSYSAVGTGVTPVTPTQFGGGPNQVFKLAGNDVFTFNAAAVPEPSTWLTLTAGLAVLGWIARRRVA